MKHYILLTSMLLCVPVILFAQVPEPYALEFKKADSLLNRGLPQSATRIAEAVYARAKEKGEPVQMLKAQLYLLRSDLYGETGIVAAIKRAETEASVTTFPNNAVWQSIAAQLYWNYYQQYRWKIMGRTAVATEINIPDMEQWDAGRYYQRVARLYKSSLSQPMALKAINIDLYEPLLEKGVNTRHLRPTLYDLLAFRALTFFENDEKDVTSPAFRFQIEDTMAFAGAEVFMNHRFASGDTTSLQWQALKIYQDLLNLHARDAIPDAFIDADLHRLQFVYKTTVLIDKKERYIQALQQIEKKYSNHPLSALAAFRVAQVLMRTEVTTLDITTRFNREHPRNGNLPAIKKQLEQIIARFPDSEGGILAAQLLASISSKELSVQTEQVVLPGEVAKALVVYRNVSKIWIRIIPVNIEDYRMAFRRGDKQWKETLLGTTPVKAWSEQLPGTADYETHSTEVKMDALPIGMYAILVSADEKFSTNSNIIQYAVFQSSRLSLITQQTGNGFVLDRKHGNGVTGASIELYREEYRNRGYELIVAKKAQSGKDGSFSTTGKDHHYSAFSVEKGNDKLYLPEYIGFYDPGKEPATTERTFFFTDRAIYRPGQTIYYKGIMTKREKGGRENNVMANKETEITFYDVNGQVVGSQKLQTNEFGSFMGSFVAPEGVLTGNMRIGNKTGMVDFSVEEYKRPKFSVAFDTITAAYALGQDISIKGSAAAYAGSAIDGASVSYRVVRRVRWPSWWGYYYWGRPSSQPEMEITRGTVHTGKDGAFTVTFAAIPDLSVNPASLPVFTYTVYADVTDVNGETRSASKTVNAGYTSLTLSAALPEKATPLSLDTIIVTTRNLNNAFIPATVRLQISRLQSPPAVLRQRLWATPDQFIMDSGSFKSLFPLDEYKNEGDPMTWDKATTVFETSVTTTKEGIIAIPVITWKENGWYLVELETTDNNGKKIQEKKLVQVWDKNNPGKLAAALTILPQSQVAEPGIIAAVQVLSGFATANIIQQEQRMDHSINTSSLNYNASVLKWTREITEADRGGIALSWVVVKENRLYIEQSFVSVPYTNKELHISWETHRDRLLPGAAETWTMVVRGDKKEKLAAEMMTALYDASLDAYKTHQWRLNDLFPHLNSRLYWNKPGFNTSGSMQLAYINQPKGKRYEKRYDELFIFSYFGHRQMQRGYDMAFDMEAAVATGISTTRAVSSRAPGVAVATQEVMADGMQANAGFMAMREKNESVTNTTEVASAGVQDDPPQNIIARKDFRETAFFYPQLKTDEQGNVRFSFTLPEALTEWKLLAVAHTKDMRTGMLEGKVKTQKDLMVIPGLPRFLRQGDELRISSKVSNMSDSILHGTASLQLLNARTLQPVNAAFELNATTVSFTAAAAQSTSVSWKVRVPDTLIEAVIIRITASAGDFTDGEENILPVLSNRMMVTETLPLWINGDGVKTFSFDKLKKAGSSKTLSHHSLSVEYTGNPAWYAVQALPYLMEYPYECSEQTFNRYYAAALASHIVQQHPRIELIFKQWEQLDTSALLSNLEKNQELKSALLQETPWVMEAKNENEQKRRIALLFQTHKLARSLETNIRKLENMMLPEGGFPWFKGMYPDRYITQYIVTGMARLQHLGIEDKRGRMQQILQRALVYLDKKMAEDHSMLVKNKAKLDDQHIGYIHVQYLYLRSFFNSTVANGYKTALNYYRQQATKYWPKFNPYMKGMIALALNRSDDRETSKDILASLRETAIVKEEMGMYWISVGRSYWWYDAPIEAQSLLIEAFTEIEKGSADIDRMKVWLLKQKQTQNWHSTKATADACYALLLSGSNWLTNEPAVTMQLGNKTIRSEALPTQKGTGYFKVNYTGSEVNPAMGDIKISISNNSSSTSWGAVYWQYFEQVDKITFAATPLVVKKDLFIQQNADRGPQLVPITSTSPLQIGDKVTARIEIIVDRDMEYVHLKDMRAAAFEPQNVISSFKWQGGLGYYEATKDASTDFFFNYLRKGKYIFEYTMFVTNKGDFSNGITTIQCMYAPEFSSHTEGSRITVH